MKRTFTQHLCNDVTENIISFLPDEEIVQYIINSEIDSKKGLRHILANRGSHSRECIAYELLKDKQKEIFLWMEKEFSLKYGGKFLEIFAKHGDIEEVRRRINHPSITAVQIILAEMMAVEGGSFETWKEINERRVLMDDNSIFHTHSTRVNSFIYKNDHIKIASEKGNLDFILSYLDHLTLRNLFRISWASTELRADILYGAGRGGHLNIIETMRTMGNVDWDATLRGCASAGRIELIDMIINRYALINLTDLYTSIINEASVNGHLDTVKHYERYFQQYLFDIDLRNIVPRRDVLEYIVFEKSSIHHRYRIEKRKLFEGAWMDDRVDILEILCNDVESNDFHRIRSALYLSYLLEYNSLKCFQYIAKLINQTKRDLNGILSIDRISFDIDTVNSKTLRYLINILKPLKASDMISLEVMKKQAINCGRHHLYNTIDNILKENIS